MEKKKVSWGTNSVIETDKYNILEKLEELTKKYDDLLKYLDKRIPNFINDYKEMNDSSGNNIIS